MIYLDLLDFLLLVWHSVAMSGNYYAKKCAICETEFVSKMIHAKYCSSRCRSEMKKRRQSQKKYSMRNYAHHHEKICPLCKKKFISYTTTKRYCSINCQREAAKISQRQHKSINYWQILNRDNFKCQYCGRNPIQHNVILHIDHIKPKADGGTDDLDNLVTACDKCNYSKSDRPLRHEAEFKKRLSKKYYQRTPQVTFPFYLKSNIIEDI